MSAPNAKHGLSGGRKRLATRLAFLIAGLGMAAWAPLVPYAKEQVGADNAMFGLLLLSLGGGSIIAMPITGFLASRYGCRCVIVAGTIGVSLMIPVLPFVDTPMRLAVSLAVFGASIGMVDVAVNIQAVMVQKDSGRSLMSGFHGLFSLGGILGAGGVSLALRAGMTLEVVVYATSTVLMLLLMLSYHGQLTYGDKEETRGQKFIMPNGIIVAIGLMCFFVLMGEGAILDWSAIFLVESHGYDQASAGLGYAAFAVMMTIGRLFGDRIVTRLGGARVVLLSGLLAGLGFAVAIWPAHPTLALAGFALVGAGLSNIVPVFFTAASKQTVLPSSSAVAIVTTMGYAGVLLGPASIGFIAQAWSLDIGLLLLAIFMCGVAFAGSRATRKN